MGRLTDELRGDFRWDYNKAFCRLVITARDYTTARQRNINNPIFLVHLLIDSRRFFKVVEEWRSFDFPTTQLNEQEKALEAAALNYGRFMANYTPQSYGMQGFIHEVRRAAEPFWWEPTDAKVE